MSMYLCADLDDPANVHLCDHLGREHEGDEQVDGERQIHQVAVVLECLGRVYTDRHETDEGTAAENAPYPHLVDPLNVRVVVQVVVRAVIRQRDVLRANTLFSRQHFAKTSLFFQNKIPRKRQFFPHHFQENFL